MADKLFIDVSMHNVGEAVFLGRIYLKTIIHDFAWNKAIAKGVEGAIIKASEGVYADPAYETMMKSCTLPFITIYGFLCYSKKFYTLGQEIDFGIRQGRFLVSQRNKFANKINCRIAIDYEQNAKWEEIANTDEDRVIDRSLKILLAMAMEIFRLTGYWPIIYTNSWLTSNMNKNFLSCPLWIATGNLSPVVFSNTIRTAVHNWTSYAIHQFEWLAPGMEYGNYYGNTVIDLNHVPDVSKILTSSAQTPPSEDEPVQFAKVATLWGVVIRSSPEKLSNNNVGLLAYSLTKTYPILEKKTDSAGNLWLLIEAGWICSIYQGQKLVSVTG